MGPCPSNMWCPVLIQASAWNVVVCGPLLVFPLTFFYYLFKFYLCLWLCCVPLAFVRAFSSCGVQGLLLLRSTGSTCSGFSSWSRTFSKACGVAPTRGQTRTPVLAGRSLTTGEPCPPVLNTEDPAL